jgi:tRNA pseudouridine55 synthase
VARRRPPTVNGLAVVDKPAGITSHDVVDVLRRRLGERRIGHAGTLDPDATGVLLAGVGTATRLLRFLSGLDKVYTGEVVLGVETSTLDAAGEVTARHDMRSITLDEVRAAVERHLTGAIMQVPPMVSALKVEGRRLHELAREGIDVEREARPVTVRRFLVEATEEPDVFAIEVEVSSGTYVRTLAADLGHLLGGGAHLRALRRRSVGPFDESEAASPDTCELLPVAEVMRGHPRLVVDDEIAALVRHGRVLDAFDGDGPWALLDAQGELLAVYEPFRAGSAKPAVVLVGAFQR